MAASRKEIPGMKCLYCGSPIVETDKGWGCSNFKGGCKAFIWKDDRFFKKALNKKMTRQYAMQLLKGSTVLIQNVVLKGKNADVTVSWGKKDDGPYEYGYEMDVQFTNSDLHL